MTTSLPRASPWTPKLWSGMSLRPWFRLLAANGFAVAPHAWGAAAVVTLFAAANSVLGRVQRAVCRRTPLRDDPLFVIGHWRTGTTLMHELLARDPEHTFPTTFRCFAPHHCLLTERLATRWPLPARRLVDGTPFGWHRPQEDEAALMHLGALSPLLAAAFPDRPPPPDALEFDRLSPDEQARWKKTLVEFLHIAAHGDERRLVLKSPEHTGRVPGLLDLFPRARFVLMVRDPYVVFPSTVRLWQVLHTTQGFRLPTFAGLDEYVLESFVRLHEAFERSRGRLTPQQLCVVRYEDLVAYPHSEIDRVYRTLGLGDSRPVRRAMAEYLEEVKHHRPNEYELSDEATRQITDRWSAYFDRHGYARRAARRRAA